MQKDVRGGLKALGGVSLIGAAALLGSTMLTSPAAAQSMEELKAQIDKLQTQVEGLEQRQAAPVQAVTGGDTPGSFKLPGSDTSMNVGGYAKLDVIYDALSRNGHSVFISAIPADGTEIDGHFQMHARQSRVWLKSSTPTDLGTVRTHIEFDFEGGGGSEVFSHSTHPRLRHAYGTMGGLLMGQTNTNFMSVLAYPETIDFGGPVGMPFQRVPQIRYTFAPTSGLSVSFSAENPETTGFDTTGALPVAFHESGAAGGGFDIFPDLTAAVQFSTGAISVRGSFIGKLLSYDDGTDDDTAIAYGAQGSFNANFGPARVFGSVHGGNGIGRHILFGTGLDATWDGAELDPVLMYGGSIGAGFKFTSTLRSSVNYARTMVEDRNTPATDIIAHMGQTVHANLIWAPVPRVKMGVEAIFGTTEREVNAAGDKEATMLRLQLGAQFTF